ncbi:MAG: hypothetical protein ABFC38_11705 [Methanospirillum sp.]
MSSDAPLRQVRYRHTQRADLLLLIFGGAVAITLIVGSAAFGGRDPIALAIATPVLAVLAVVLVLFSSLTVVVDHEVLRIAFGLGLVRYAWPLDRVRAWQVVRNPWWYGWGIHLTPGGWLYNVSGSEAVEIVISDGRRRRIGTDDPAGFMAALEAAPPGDVIDPGEPGHRRRRRYRSALGRFWR